MGVWPGKSVWTENGSRKEGQLRLGKVINKEKLIFYKVEYGFFRFDPEDQSIHDIPPQELPSCLVEQDKRLRQPPVIVSFGGSYFLHKLLHDIEYNPVIDCIQYSNSDRLYSMIHYYILEDRANRHAEKWYRHNFTKFLYPKANLSSQRISDFLAAIGTSANKRIFLTHHMRYLRDIKSGANCVLIDSTGCANKCSLYVTRLSVHEGEKSIAFRVIAVVQKTTGLPLYYQIIPGNVVDISTVMYVIRVMKKLGYEVDYVIGDAGYCCPTVMERMIWAGVEFMSRLAPHFSIFKDIVKDHIDELRSAQAYTYRNRRVRMLKVKKVVAHDRKTNDPVYGYVYLCLDIQAHHSKIDHLMNSKAYTKMTTEEFEKACDKLGLFAIVTTRNLPPEDILPEYYIRQAIEQFFDFAKNYARFIPVRCQNMDTLNGHMLLAFIASFVISLTEYRLNRVNTRYVSISENMLESGILLRNNDLSIVELDNGEETIVMKQDVLTDIFRESSNELFQDLQYQMAEVFDDEVIPEPTVETGSLYGAYGLHSPYYVTIKDGTVIPVLREKDIDTCCKALAFAEIPSISDEEIEAKRASGKLRKVIKAAAEMGLDFSGNSKPVTQGDPLPDAADTTTANNADDTESKPTHGRGRPKGSKNKKTLERERLEQEQRGTDNPDNTSDKDNKSESTRGRGRPKGSKNKKTLERERLERKD